VNGLTREKLAGRRIAAASASGEEPRPRASAGPLTFTRLKWTSFAHSCVYLALLICAFAAGNPQPLTFILGLTHGLLWIFMSLACLTAARLRIVTLRLAVAVAVLGGIAPFFGSFEFIREQRKRAALE
jgi:type IV secretory pathway VirB6-like protein